ncbi:MAG: hypothetical protein AAGD10_02030 [Myxococcota bacterium]
MKWTREERIQRLMREHAELEKRLAKLDGRNFLSEMDRLEKRKLQKLKLLKKDQLLELGAA